MICLVTGGARSGKSAYAESLIESFAPGERIYIATMDPGNDPENHARIEKHRAQRREKGFQTVECQTGLADADVPSNSIVLLECLTNLVANEMFREDGAGEQARDAVLAGARHICERARDVVFVSNNVFADGGPYEETVDQYRRALSEVEGNIACRADLVVELVCGIPLIIKERSGSRS